IDKARQRNIYDDLQTTDILTALRAGPSRFDLITAADVLEYVGDLSEFLPAAAAALRPTGLLAFSVLKTDEPNFVFDRARMHFAHNLHYILDLAKHNHLAPLHTTEAPLRTQFGRPVPSWIIVLQKP